MKHIQLTTKFRPKAYKTIIKFGHWKWDRRHFLVVGFLQLLFCWVVFSLYFYWLSFLWLKFLDAKSALNPTDRLESRGEYSSIQNGHCCCYCCHGMENSLVLRGNDDVVVRQNATLWNRRRWWRVVWMF